MQSYEIANMCHAEVNMHMSKILYNYDKTELKKIKMKNLRKGKFLSIILIFYVFAL